MGMYQRYQLLAVGLLNVPRINWEDLDSGEMQL